MHLVVDGFGASPEKLQDLDGIRRLLDELPGRIGMTKISEPHVLAYEGPKREDWGISGFVIIAESHISVHTFPYRGYVNVDVFSCKEFDPQRVLAELRDLLSLGDTRCWVLERGLEYLGPAHARREVALERQRLGAQC